MKRYSATSGMFSFKNKLISYRSVKLHVPMCWVCVSSPLLADCKTVESHPCPIPYCRIIVGAPRGSAPMKSLATGLVYVCPLAPGPCELLTNNTGELAASMLQGVCVCVLYLCAVLCCVCGGGGLVYDCMHCGIGKHDTH